MKVLILGGYGVFGERLARLLVRDGHDVTVAGRSLEKAESLALDIGCLAARVDRSGPLDCIADFDVVVDAAGPFHAYGQDPYRVARSAILQGTHYLDLCDDTDFCLGISELDEHARLAGVCVLSGLSSVPALSSAAVAALAAGDRPEMIETAILPGNRSPRGLSVMQSILSQAGRPFSVWRAGDWTQSRGWSDPKSYRLPKGVVRQGWQIAVPDHRLFPAHFNADTVLFRAGLELAVMRYGLAAFARVRRIFPFTVTLPLVRVFKRAADLLEPFGTGSGGMSVMVVAGGERRYWRLLAEEGDGPFIPAISVRALLRRKSLPSGAAPALGAVSLQEAEAAMDGLKTTTEIVREPVVPAFRKVLREAFDRLPPEIRETHETIGVSRWAGKADVERGKGIFPRLIAFVMRFPAQGAGVDVEVTKSADETGETWERRFGANRFHSHLSPTDRGMTERFSMMTFRLGLHVKDGSLHFPVTSGRIGVLPIPAVLLPRSEAREYVEEGRFHFDVALEAPVTGHLIIRYRGHLSRAPAGNSLRPPIAKSP